MSFRPLLNHLEITLLQSVTNLMRDSTVVRFAMPRLYRFYQAFPDNDQILQGLMWVSSGLMVGFALGALFNLIW